MIFDAFERTGGTQRATIGIKAHRVVADLPLGDEVVIVLLDVLRLRRGGGVALIDFYELGHLIVGGNELVSRSGSSAGLFIHKAVNHRIGITGHKLPAFEGVALAHREHLLVLNLLQNRIAGDHPERSGGRSIAFCDLSPVRQVDEVRIVLGITGTNDDGMVLRHRNVGAGSHRLAFRGGPATELVFRVVGIVEIILIRQHDYRLLANNDIVIDGITVRVLNLYAGGLEYSFSSKVAAFVLHPHHDRLSAVELIVYRGSVRHLVKILPVGLGWSGILIVSDPIGSNTRATVILDEGNAVIVDTLTSVGKGKGGGVLRGVSSLDKRNLIVEECSDIGLRSLGFITILVFDRKLEDPFTVLAVLVENKVRNL